MGYERDCVYYSADSHEYRNAHISVAIGNEQVEITIFSDDRMNLSEIESVLSSIEADVLRKSRIRLTEECLVVLMADGARYRLMLAEEKPYVRQLSPM